MLCFLMARKRVLLALVCCLFSAAQVVVSPQPGRADDVRYVLLQPEATEDESEDPSDIDPDDPLRELQELDPLASLAPEPPAPLSSLLDRLNNIAAPGATAVLVADEPPVIDVVQLTRSARSSTSSAGIRRAEVSIQPVIRGYGQQSVYGQYQGARFTPVRFDLDSMLTSIDPGVIDNLVIIPGPYGVKYGPGLAFIDFQARPLARYDSADWHSVTKVLYRSNGGQFYGREMVVLGGPSYGARVSFGHKQGSDYRAGDSTQIPASYQVQDLNAAASVDLTDVSSLQFEYIFQDLSDTEFAGLVFDARVRRTEAYSLRYTHDDFGPGVRLLAEGWYNRTFFDGDNFSESKQTFYQTNPVFIPEGSFLGTTDADSTNTGGRISATVGDDGASRLTTGLDFRYHEYNLNEFDDFGFGFDSYPVPRSSIIDCGAFAELGWPSTAGTRVTTGVRVDWIRTRRPSEYETVTPDGFVDAFIYDGELRDDDLLLHGFVTIDRELNECLRFKAGCGHGARPANPTERFAEDPFLTVVQNATTAVLGDENLRPERATQVDLSLQGEFDRFRFRLSGFASYISDYITLAPAEGIPPDPDLRLLDFVNHDSTLAGGDLSAEFDLHANWTPFATCSYQEGQNRVLDEPLPNIFPLQSRLGIRWHDPQEEVYSVEFVAWVVDNQARLATSLLELPTAGFTRLDLRGRWQVSESLRLTAGIQNLGDRTILEHLSVHNPRVLEPGLNAYFSAEIVRR